jgi:DNA ligase-1
VAVQEDDGQLRPSGIIEFGVTTINKKAFYGVVNSLITNENAEYVYIEPLIRGLV